ncbi:MerR family transcriptional regulator [Gracilibacillus salitolerans]|uniref:MerR family transcriptional regulator n=1 Tax=Gracilibacillus salitolerans TaxID=2663022 RepID=A0A5Q2TP60_9BACI|nr:MerR family transcriptional regulator [Gracilibacillus salitolerans]QGH36759.1 MerR family transcriptional regulator [Gracilibacillus salitolerans]
MTKQTYLIGEFSKRTGISIRTLHYYDEIGLLQPEKHPNSGHRMYTDEDVVTLQKIVSLKFLGYSLEKIGELLNHSSFTVSLNSTLNLHMKKLEEEKEHIERSLAAIRRTITILEDEREVDSSVLVTLIGNMQTEKHQKEWLEKYQLAVVAEIFDEKSEEEKLAIDKEYIRVAKGLKRLFGRPVEDEEVQKLVVSYMEAIFTFLGKDVMTELGNMNVEIEKLKELEALVPSPFTKEEEEWLMQAMDYYLEKIGYVFLGADNEND